MSNCPGDQLSRWATVRVSKCPGEQVSRWATVRMSNCPYSGDTSVSSRGSDCCCYCRCCSSNRVCGCESSIGSGDNIGSGTGDSNNSNSENDNNKTIKVVILLATRRATFVFFKWPCHWYIKYNITGNNIASSFLFILYHRYICVLYIYSCVL